MNTSADNKKKIIDIEELIRSKNSRLAKVLPRFIIRYLKRVLHQDELNAAIERNKDLWGIDFVREVLKEFSVNIVVKDIENLPVEDRICVISNHPLGGLDGMVLIQVVANVRKPIRFPVNDLLMSVPNLRELFIPINKHGSNTENAVIFDNAFASDETILYFPAGLCSRKIKGTIQDLEWKKTVLSKAKKHKRDIVPVHIDGQNSNFFYHLSNRRRFLGIKSNIEMLYLVDEMYNQRNKKITITFGKPIPYGVFDKRHTDMEWISLLRKHVYNLKEKNVTFDPNQTI
ncbi:MAG: 1-acyl-sn-glycerol-3-phosphate acyltransferase [Bacteroidota bacterium]